MKKKKKKKERKEKDALLKAHINIIHFLSIFTKKIKRENVKCNVTCNYYAPFFGKFSC